MRRLLLLAVVVLLPASVAAQNWMFDTNFPTSTDVPEAALNGLPYGHGIAVDPDGKIWFTYYYASDSVQVPELMAGDARNGYRDVRVAYVFNSDGSTAAINPVKYLDFPGGDRDTLGGYLRRDTAGAFVWEGNSSRGLRADPTGMSVGGDVLASMFNFIYRIDYQTGAGVAKNRFENFCAGTQATSDELGNVYYAPVCPGQPIVSLAGSDLSFQENVTDASNNFSRGIQVSKDGLTLFESDYENTFTIIHQRADEFSPWDSVGVTLRGMRVESMAIQPGTEWVWASSGSPNNPPNQDPTVATSWDTQSWYAFDMADLLANEVPTPLDSIKWNNPQNISATDAPRPRGLAFTPDGGTAYITQFGGNSDAPAQKFSRTSNPATEPGAIPGVARLLPNLPNPTAGTTEIRFELANGGATRVRVLDVTGRELMTLVNETLPAGSHSRTVSVNSLPAGAYVYTLEVEGRTTSRQMMVVR